MKLSTELIRRATHGLDATPPPRKPRGQGKTAMRKAAIAERLPMVLALLGVDRLPDGVSVNPFPGTPNGQEKRYGDQLDLMQYHGVKAYAFQPIRLQLAPGVSYCPDWVWRIMGEKAHIDEIKGQYRDNTAVRFKIASHRFPQFAFRMLRLVKGNWREVRLSGLGRKGFSK